MGYNRLNWPDLWASKQCYALQMEIKYMGVPTCVQVDADVEAEQLEHAGESSTVSAVSAKQGKHD